MATEELIAKARKQGFVTYEEVYAQFPNVDDHLDEIDALCLKLLDLGIEIVSEAAVPEVPEVAEPEQEAEQVSLPEQFESPEDLYNLYMLEVRQINLLTAKEEVKLAKLIQQGEKAKARLSNLLVPDSSRAQLEEAVRKEERARERFIQANLRLVVSIAWRYRGRGLPLLDLIQEGSIGLMKAVERWDYRLGYRFSTYATWWIRQAIQRAIADLGSIIRLPVHIREDLGKIERAIDELRVKLGQKPTRAQVSQHSGVKPERVSYLLGSLPEICSLDTILCCPDFPLLRGAAGDFVQQTPCQLREWAERFHLQVALEDDFDYPPCLADAIDSKEGDSTGQVNYSLFNSATTSPQQSLTSKLLRETIDRLLHTLTERQREVIEMRFGLRDNEERTLEEVGQEFGLTRERIRQIQVKAIQRLQHPTRISKLRRFWEELGDME